MQNFLNINILNFYKSFCDLTLWSSDCQESVRSFSDELLLQWCSTFLPLFRGSWCFSVHFPPIFRATDHFNANARQRCAVVPRRIKKLYFFFKMPFMVFSVWRSVTLLKLFLFLLCGWEVGRVNAFGWCAAGFQDQAEKDERALAASQRNRYAEALWCITPVLV